MIPVEGEHTAWVSICGLFNLLLTANGHHRLTMATTMS